MGVLLSYLLLPLFLFSLVISPNITEKALLWTFIIAHIFLHPTTIDFRSSSEENGIGDPANSRPANRGLQYLSFIMVAAAITLGYLEINVTFAVMVLIYSMLSKSTRFPFSFLRGYAPLGRLATGLLQGMFIFALCYVGINRFSPENIVKASVLIPAILCGVLFLGSCTLPQRGDKMFSGTHGIRHTFYFVAGLFLLFILGCFLFLNSLYEPGYALIFLGSQAPVVFYFAYWFFKSRRTGTDVTRGHLIRLSIISATMLNIFFVYLFLYANHYIQVFT